MTVDDVRHRREEIKRLGDFDRAADYDPEEAHRLEDGLWLDVLQTIAAGAPNAAELAREALRTRRLGFPRRYA